MKTTGGRDTFLLFVVLILVIGAVCYMFVIKRSLNKLNQASQDLAIVEQEKAEKDKIIAQAEELDQIRETLKKSLEDIEKKLLPDLYTQAIQRKLYKHFEDAGIPYYVELSNDAKKYETVTLPDGTASPDRVAYSSYKLTVSGTDGWLLTHDEGDKIPFEVFYEQSIIDQTTGGVVSATTPNTVPNKSATEAGITDVKAVRSEQLVGYKEFMAAIKKIQDECPEYVKIVDVGFEDQGQGFGYFTATVNVYAFDLVNRQSAVNNNMNYMVWVGADKIATGGLVGMPSYFTLSSPNYNVSEDSPLYGHYVSLVDYKFNVNRPFASWNMWGYEWMTLKTLLESKDAVNPDLLELDLKLRLGMITMEEYTKESALIVGSGVTMQEGTTTDNTATTPAT